MIFDTQRLAQMGSWSGTLDRRWTGSDASTRRRRGVRETDRGVCGPSARRSPTASAKASTRWAAGCGSYFPMRFEDHSIFYICSRDGRRHAHAGTGRAGVARWPDRAARAHRPRPPSPARTAGSCRARRSPSWTPASTSAARRCCRTTSPSGRATASSPTGATACGRDRSPSCRASSTRSPRSRCSAATPSSTTPLVRVRRPRRAYGLYEHAFSGTLPKYGLE